MYIYIYLFCIFLSTSLNLSVYLSLYYNHRCHSGHIHAPFVPRKATQVALERRNAKPDQFCRIFSLNGKWSSLCLWQECLIFEAKQFHEPLKCLRAPRSLGLRISGAGLGERRPRAGGMVPLCSCCGSAGFRGFARSSGRRTVPQR